MVEGTGARARRAAWGVLALAVAGCHGGGDGASALSDSLSTTLYHEGTCMHLACNSSYRTPVPVANQSLPGKMGFYCANKLGSSPPGWYYPLFFCGLDDSCDDNGLWLSIPNAARADCGHSCVVCAGGKQVTAPVKDKSHDDGGGARYEASEGVFQALGITDGASNSAVHIYRDPGDPRIKNDIACNPIKKCTGFHEPGCVDFAGGVYSGGDHRRVATGSLAIGVDGNDYCQERSSCAFQDCYVCPHLDTSFPIGATVTAIATPGAESVFARWGAGACAGQGPTCSFVATKPSCISAQFLLAQSMAPPQSLPDVPCPQDPTSPDGGTGPDGSTGP